MSFSLFLVCGPVKIAPQMSTDASAESANEMIPSLTGLTFLTPDRFMTSTSYRTDVHHYLDPQRGKAFPSLQPAKRSSLPLLAGTPRNAPKKNAKGLRPWRGQG